MKVTARRAHLRTLLAGPRSVFPAPVHDLVPVRTWEPGIEIATFAGSTSAIPRLGHRTHAATEAMARSSAKSTTAAGRRNS